MKYEATKSVQIKSLYTEAFKPVSGSLWQMRAWKTQAEPGTAGYSQVQCQKSHHVLYFSKDIKDFKDIKYNTAVLGGHKKCPKKL